MKESEKLLKLGWSMGKGDWLIVKGVGREGQHSIQIPSEKENL